MADQPKPDTTFEFLLNAMEQALTYESPAKHGYADKRRAVLDYVAKLEEPVKLLSGVVADSNAARRAHRLDEFAKAALTGLITSTCPPGQYGIPAASGWRASIAEEAFDLAEAMEVEHERRMK